jgi:hypothetical protein
MRFAFAFDPVARAGLLLLGVRPANSFVEVTDERFEARFGPWRLSTPLSNVVYARVTGPYRWIKAIGPRGSKVDHGATFGTNARGGCCVCFEAPVGSLLGPNRFLHPALTVTVTDPDALAEHLHTVAPRLSGPPRPPAATG